MGLGLYVLTIVLPLTWALSTSLKTGPEIFAHPWGPPSSPAFGNFGKAWTEAGIGSYFFNSVFATGVTLLVLLPIGALAAYVFARFRFWGRNVLYTAMIAQMLFPNFLVVVPVFLLLKDMSLLGTRQGLVLVYVAYSLSFTIFVLRGFFESIPLEMEEAAVIDGCSPLQVFWRVMMPLCRPALVMVAIFNGIGLWNEYQLALVLCTDKNFKTLPLGIAELVMTQHYESDWGAMFAGLVITMIPVMVVYWIFQDRIHQAMLAGAVKG
ncbi:MAG: carbohydrate ABC transporter permease [bacterium]